MYIGSVNYKPVQLGLMKISNSLLYAVKTISGDSENEIITYFYNLGVSLFNDAISRRKLPQRCNRTVKLMYKNTSLGFKLDVWSSYFNHKWYSGEKIQVNITVGHIVSDWRQINSKDLNNMLSETGLGLNDEPVIDARKPISKTYKCLANKPRSSVDNIDYSALPEELRNKYSE